VLYLVIGNGQNVNKLRIDIINPRIFYLLLFGFCISNNNNNNNKYENSCNIPSCREHCGLADFLCGMYSTVTYHGVRNVGCSGFAKYGTFTLKVKILWNTGFVQICELYARIYFI